MNKAIEGHPLVGVEAVWRAGEEPTPRSAARDATMVVGNGFPVTVEAVFEDWNGVKGLDMLYVNVHWTSHHTHVTPEDLGLNPVASYRDGGA